MKYIHNLSLRVLLAFAILLLPIDIFYLLLLKPALYSSAFFLSSYNPIITADSLVINGTILKFIPACIASLAYLLLILLILLTKGLTLKKSITLFLLGSVIIFVANIIRIDALIYVYFEYGRDLFNQLHLLIWDVLSSVFVASMWIAFVYAFRIESRPVYDDILALYKAAKGKR